MKARLSKNQITTLIIPARRAHAYRVARGEIVGVDFDTWRREEVERCTGKPGLRACDNSDFNRLLAHFESLAGEDGRAMDALVREATEPRRQAEAALVLAMDRAGLGPAYVEKIARDKFKCAVTDASVRQLHQLIITVNARAAARARKAASTPSTPSRPLASIRGSEIGGPHV